MLWGSDSEVKPHQVHLVLGWAPKMGGGGATWPLSHLDTTITAQQPQQIFSKIRNTITENPVCLYPPFIDRSKKRDVFLFLHLWLKRKSTTHSFYGTSFRKSWWTGSIIFGKHNSKVRWERKFFFTFFKLETFWEFSKMTFQGIKLNYFFGIYVFFCMYLTYKN